MAEATHRRVAVQRALVIVAGASAAVAGTLANLVSLPVSCATTLGGVIAAAPYGPMLWLGFFQLWLAMGVGIVALLVHLLGPGHRRSWAWAAGWSAAVLGLGLLGASIPYYWLAAPMPDFQCGADPLWGFTFIGGLFATVSGLSVLFVEWLWWQLPYNKRQAGTP